MVGVFPFAMNFPRFPLVLVAAITALFAGAAPASAAVANGQPAPDFTLTDIDGQPHHLSDYKGKTVVLEWNNPDCPIVHKHYDSGNIPGLQKAAAADGVVWLLINSGAPGKEGGDYTADQIKAWLKERGSVPTAYLRDPTGTVGHLYGAQTTPHMFVITADGMLVYHGGIDSIASADQADIPRAENYVKEALAEVKAGQPVAKGSSRPYGCTVKY
jgi:AhpC/TSA family